MPSIEFFGEQIALADEISEWALMEFAEAAEHTDEASLGGYAAVMRLLEEAVAAQDWQRFRSLARKNKATSAQCMPAVVAVFEAQTDRPTSRPAVSSDGPPATAPSSTVGSSSLVTSLSGRPDLQVAVLRARESLAS